MLAKLTLNIVIVTVTNSQVDSAHMQAISMTICGIWYSYYFILVSVSSRIHHETSICP